MPTAADICRDVAAWRGIEAPIRVLARLNRDEILERVRRQKTRRGPRHPAAPAGHNWTALLSLATRA